MKSLYAALMFCAALSAQVDSRSFHGVKEFILDNVNGPIEVIGSAGDTVSMEAIRDVRASTEQDRAQANQEVKLVVEQAGEKVNVRVEYPCNDRRRRDYNVKYSFKLQVPASVKLDARTVNGGVLVRYDRSPSADVRLETVNGSVDTAFGPGLAADVRTRTMNGGVYSDFEVKPLPARVSVDRAEGMTRYRSDGGGFRVGAGGPQFEFRTLNGNIFLRSNQK
jgi:DUF4097 and DUF4098 domain-containing protein YvlB